MNDTAPAYIRVGKRRIRIPRRRGVRIALASALLVRGLIPCVATPLLLSASITLLSMDVPRIRRWRRRLLVTIEHKRRGRPGRDNPGDTQQTHPSSNHDGLRGCAARSRRNSP